MFNSESTIRHAYIAFIQTEHSDEGVKQNTK